MRIIGTGIDIVEIARLQRSLDRFGDRFLDRVFTAEERRYCQTIAEPARCYAARFAAKEAVSKAFGTGIGQSLGWLDLVVERSPAGQPSILLQGNATATARALGITGIKLSLSHSDHYAVAQAIACGE
jgi:holo-[acyl-carrier protein] synthase